MSEEQAPLEVHQWVRWNDAARQVTAAGLGPHGHSILLDWAEAGMIEARAHTLLRDGKPVPGGIVPAALWPITRKAESGFANWQSGQFQARLYEGLRGSATYRGFGLSFRRDQLDALTLSPAPSIVVPGDIEPGVHLSPYLLVMIEAARRSGIGPEIERQVEVESLKATIGEVAIEQGLSLSERDVGSMASLIRDPASRVGIRKLKADARRDAD